MNVMIYLSRVTSLLVGLGLIIGGAFMSNRWGSGAVNTAAGLALIGIGSGLCAFTGWIAPQPKFAKASAPPPEGDDVRP